MSDQQVDKPAAFRRWHFDRFFATHTGLLVMLLMLFFQPLFKGTEFGRILFSLVMSAALITGVLSIHHENRHRILVLFLAVFAITSRWFEQIGGGADEGALLAGELSAAVFFAYAALAIFVHILRTATITPDTISAAVSLYLLIGTVFALLFTCINTMQPGAFSFPAAESTDMLQVKDARTFIYFSFVTLTTVGFGDTVPVSDAARAFTLLEAICGQMFIAIILASLVGKMIAHSTKN